LTSRRRPGAPPQSSTKVRAARAAPAHAWGAAVHRAAPPKFLQGQMFQAACVSRESPVTLSVRIDTDHEGFRQAILAQDGALERQELIQTVQVRFFDAKQLGVYLDQEGTLTLILKPALPVPAYFGFAAIDVGNTSCTMVSLLKSDALYRTSNIRVVNADAPRGELRDHVEPVVSHVRIDRIRSYEPPTPGVRRFPDLN